MTRVTATKQPAGTDGHLCPTDEQQAIIDAFRGGSDLIIEAGAGCGKTATLALMAEAIPDTRGSFIAFNKSIADDASHKFPARVDCRTSHSLAFRAVGQQFAHRLGGPRLRSFEVAQMLGITRFEAIRTVAGQYPMKPATQAYWAIRTVRNFCYSADEQIEPWHVPTAPNLRHSELAPIILPHARRAWKDIQSENGRIPFEHDHYLKIWALTHPTLGGDFVLLDEAQDSNSLLIRLVSEQDCQKAVVGDSNQTIYSWRGTKNALADFEGTRLFLSNSFRFGDAIASAANRWLDYLQSPLRLKGLASIESQIADLEHADAVLCRTNAEAVRRVIGAQARGLSAALVGGGGEIRSFAEAALGLKAGQPTSHAQLFSFKSWGEVLAYVESDDPEATELMPMVNLVEKITPDGVLRAVDSLSDEGSAQVVVSTAHRAKGREWHSVKLAGDFLMPGDKRWQEEESRLNYVAVTRARLTLDHHVFDALEERVADTEPLNLPLPQ